QIPFYFYHAIALSTQQTIFSIHPIMNIFDCALNKQEQKIQLEARLLRCLPIMLECLPSLNFRYLKDCASGPMHLNEKPLPKTGDRDLVWREMKRHFNKPFSPC